MAMINILLNSVYSAGLTKQGQELGCGICSGSGGALVTLPYEDGTYTQRLTRISHNLQVIGHNLNHIASELEQIKTKLDEIGQKLEALQLALQSTPPDPEAEPESPAGDDIGTTETKPDWIQKWGIHALKEQLLKEEIEKILMDHDDPAQEKVKENIRDIQTFLRGQLSVKDSFDMRIPNESTKQEFLAYLEEKEVSFELPDFSDKTEEAKSRWEYLLDWGKRFYGDLLEEVQNDPSKKEKAENVKSYCLFIASKIKDIDKKEITPGRLISDLERQIRDSELNIRALKSRIEALPEENPDQYPLEKSYNTFQEKIFKADIEIEQDKILKAAKEWLLLIKDEEEKKIVFDKELKIRKTRASKKEEEALQKLQAKLKEKEALIKVPSINKEEALQAVNEEITQISGRQEERSVALALLKKPFEKTIDKHIELTLEAFQRTLSEGRNIANLV